MVEGSNEALRKFVGHLREEFDKGGGARATEDITCVSNTVLPTAVNGSEPYARLVANDGPSVVTGRMPGYVPRPQSLVLGEQTLPKRILQRVRILETSFVELEKRVAQLMARLERPE